MAVMRDSFTGATGSLLTDHVADTGEVWTLPYAAYTASPIITAAGSLRGDLGSALAQSSWVPPSPDYSVWATMRRGSSTEPPTGLCGRITSSAGIPSFVLARFNPNNNEWEMYLFTDNVNDVHSSSAAGVPAAGNSAVMELRFSGSVASLLTDGVVRCEKALSGVFLQAGRVGVRINGSSADDTGASTLDDFTAIPVDSSVVRSTARRFLAAKLL